MAEYPYVFKQAGLCCANDLEGCNEFCCNCNGCDYQSCRNNRNSLYNAISKEPPVYVNPAQKILKAADSNKDGVIDLKEAAGFVNKEVEVSGEVPDWFKRMDTNKDGVIQPVELDKDYYYGSGEEGEESSDIKVEVRLSK